MTIMFSLILPLMFVVECTLSWGADGGTLISAAHSEQYSIPNYWGNYGRNRVVYYSQPVAQQQQRLHQQRKPNYFNNRVRDRELDDDRIVFDNDAPNSFRSNAASATAFAKTAATSSSSVHGFVPSSAKSKKEENIEWTTVAPASSTPAIHSGTKEQSANAIPAGPSKCVWAIISCCTPRSNVIRHDCFDLLGCQGAFWDTNPCEGRIMQSAVKLALNFYTKR